MGTLVATWMTSRFLLLTIMRLGLAMATAALFRAAERIADLGGSFTLVFLLSGVMGILGLVASSRLPGHE